MNSPVDTALRSIRGLSAEDLRGAGDLTALHSAASQLTQLCAELIGQRQNDLDELPTGLAEQAAALQAQITRDGKQTTMAAFELVNAMIETAARHLGGRYPDLHTLAAAVRAESPVAADALQSLITAQADAYTTIAGELLGSISGHHTYQELADGEQQLESGEIWTQGELDGFVYAPKPGGSTWHVRKAYRQGGRSSPMFCGSLPECRVWLASFLAEPEGEQKRVMRSGKEFQCRCGSN